MKEKDQLVKSQLLPLLGDLSNSLFAPGGGVELYYEIRHKLGEKAAELGLSPDQLKQIKREYEESLAHNARPGGVTKLPEITEDETNKGIAPFSISEFVQQYVGWQIDDVEVHDGAWWLKLGRNYFGNSDIETRQLLFFLQENPDRVANFLESVWPVPDVKSSWTDPYRQKAEEGSLKKIQFADQN